MTGTRNSELPPETINHYALMQMAADVARDNIRAAWRRPVRPNLRLERAALWGAILLHSECKKAMDPQNADLLLPTGHRADLQYQLQTAVRSAKDLVPFSDAECNEIAGYADSAIRDDYQFASDTITARRPDEVARWHDWLWAGDYDRPTRTMVAGGSAVYVTACVMLSQSVATVVETSLPFER
jgi:hypothetical protein